MNNGDVEFVLTPEDFETFEKRLTDCGIRVRPQSRETVEDIEKGRVSHVTISGILTCGGAEYIYHLSKYPNSCSLTVDAFSHGADLGKNLITDLKQIFPQRDGAPVIQPNSEARRDTATIFGCLLILVFFGAICFFTVVGFKSFFWK